MLLLGTTLVFGQNAKGQAPSTIPLKSISGRVTDAATHIPLSGVHVQSYGNERYAAMTGENGIYTIKVPEYVTSLAIQVEGYNLAQTAISKRTKDVDVALHSEVFTERYEHSTIAAKSTSAVGFNQTNDLSIEPQIQSKLGGDVRTITRSGLPGVGAVMFMNGLNSLSANAQPLIVLDGVLLDMQYNRSMIHDGYYNNLLSNLNVSDIAKVTVVKNGTGIYGAKGGNGVLLIDTKRNQSMGQKMAVEALLSLSRDDIRVVIATTKREELAKRVPLGRLGTPDEVAQSVLMVIGNAYLTGQTIQANGGMHFN